MGDGVDALCQSTQNENVGFRQLPRELGGSSDPVWTDLPGTDNGDRWLGEQSKIASEIKESVAFAVTAKKIGLTDVVSAAPEPVEHFL
ncbi:hypothetical protein U8P75_16285 [Rhizobium beringeri]|nr:hypothetical protein U8P75_16285 [Rhizobium beringeri]